MVSRPPSTDRESLKRDPEPNLPSFHFEATGK